VYTQCFKPSLFTDATVLFSILLYVLFTIILIYRTKVTIKNMKSQKCKYWKSFWNFIDPSLYYSGWFVEDLPVIVVVLLSRSLPSLYYSGWFVEDLAVIVVVHLSRSLPSLYYSGWFVEDLAVIVVLHLTKSSTNHPE
jgi:hypothetical protein